MADLRPQFSEEAVGANHPTKTDVINRAHNVEHEEDGTHKDITQGDGKSVTTDKIEARDGDGLLLEDDGGNGIKVMDGGTVHMAAQSGFSAYLSADQDIPNTTLTLVEFDSEEDDVQGEFNVGTYTFTAAKDGIYQVSGVLVTKEVMADVKYFQLRIYKNGAWYSTAMHHCSLAAAVGASISLRLVLAATDNVDIRVYHSYGEARQLDKSYCRFSIAKIA